jgi:hypothetical protein
MQLREATKTKDIHELRAYCQNNDINYLINQIVNETVSGPLPYLTTNEAELMLLVASGASEIGKGKTSRLLKVSSFSNS